MKKLFTTKRFAPFYVAMSMEAFNDNLFKSALVILIAYSFPKEQADILVQLCAGIFILPFFLFSGITGQLCDKYDKSTIIRMVKTFEVIIMITASFGFFSHQIPLLITALFMMGIHSTVFGPAKYSILPQHLNDDELLFGNSLVSLGTFLAILFGTILAGYLVSKDVVANYSMYPISISIITIALIGLSGSLFIPKAPPASPSLKIRWNPLTETIRTIKLANTKKSLLLSILGISWFWFYGFFFLASLPSYCRDALGGDEIVASLLLTLVSVGMGLGSVVVNKFSNDKMELGIIHFAGIGLSLFAIDLFLVGKTAPENLATFLSIKEIVSNPLNYRIFVDLFLIGLSGGAFIVPLYVLLQEKSPKEIASQIIASNNIINALFMVGAALFAIILFKLGLSIITIFLVVGLINLFILSFIFYLIPRDFLKMFVNIIIRLFYRFSVNGSENLPKNGPYIIVANHLSFIDPFVIAAGIPHPPCYVMDMDYYVIPVFKQICDIGKAIPITPKKIDPHALDRAFLLMEKRIEEGEVVALFPEAFITRDGEMIPFKDGFVRLAKEMKVPVVPIAITGLWGSWFTRSNGKALSGFPLRKLWAKIGINIGKPVPYTEASADLLYKMVKELRGENR